MILFISAWHLGMVVTAIVALAAFMGVAGILWEAMRVYDARQTLDQMDAITASAKRDRRSAAAKKGHETRRAKRPLELEAEAEVDRVLRAIDAQAEAKQR